MLTMSKLTAPKTLNGADVRLQSEHRSCVTVLVERDHPVHPYVVATWWPGLGSTWMHGHYHSSIHEATNDFWDVAARNSRH